MLVAISIAQFSGHSEAVVTSHTANLSNAVKKYLLKRGVNNGRLDVKPNRHHDPTERSVNFFIEQDEQSR
jgi:hypothetical protein